MNLTIQAHEGVPLLSPRSERRLPLCHKLLLNSSLYELLMKFDAALAEEARKKPCSRCGACLHRDQFPRKPRVPDTVVLPKAYKFRFSFTCASCDKRHTPASTRFLGRRIFLGVVVVLATAMQQGPAPWRCRRLREVLGVSTRTLKRWRTWWREVFAETVFWNEARSAFSPPVDATEAPFSLLERFVENDDVSRLVALMRFLSPLSTPSGYVPDLRQ